MTLNEITLFEDLLHIFIENCYIIGNDIKMKCLGLMVDMENFHPRPYSYGYLSFSVVFFKMVGP